MSESGSTRSFRDRIVEDYSGYKLYDERGEKIGKVEYTVLDSEGMPEYLAVKTGLFGSNTTLIPERIARLGDRDNEFEVRASEDTVKDAPTFGNEDDVTPDFENRVLEHFGLGGTGAAAGASSAAGDRTRDEGTGGSGIYGEERDRDYEGRDDRPAESRSTESRSTESRSERGSREPDRGGFDREPGRGEASGATTGGEREKVRVTVKREKAYAERVRGEDGKEEVRIRKEMIEEEELVEVEDRLS